MSIPLATTTITVTRHSGPIDEEQTPTEVATGVRAHISSPTGRETGGTQENVDAVLNCDVCDLTSDCTVTDDVTEAEWAVVWARKRIGLGLDHISAGLHATAGIG